MAEAIEIQHTDATPWELSTERAEVFRVVRPNPAFVQPEEREVAYVEGEVAPPYDVPEQLVEVYTMPAKPNAGLALEYLRRARENEDLAASWLFELAVGREGYDALVTELSNEPDPDIAQATLKTVLRSVAIRALGGLGKA